MRNPSYFLGRLLLLFLSVLAPLLTLHGYSLYRNHRDALARADSEVLLRSRDAAKDLDAELQRAENILTLLASRDEVSPATPERCQTLLHGMGTIDPLLGTIALVDTQGHLVCAATENRVVTSYEDAAWFQAALKNQGFSFQAPFLSRRTHLQVAVLAHARPALRSREATA